jgi:drug/metabolite transporter (DMT)-like permease
MNRNTYIKWGLFILLALTWGSSFILMKEGLKGLNAYQVASLRILSAGIVLLPLLRKALKEIPKKMIRPVIISGFLGTFFPAFLFCIAQTRIDSSLAGVLNALTPIFTIALGVAFFKLKIGWVKWAGMLLGFLGMLLLVLGGVQHINLNYLGYAFLVLMATICYGLNVNMVHQYLKEMTPLYVATIAFTALIPPSVLILAGTGFFSQINFSDATWLRSSGSSIALGILGTGIASVFFYTLVKKAGPVFASMVTYGIPFVAIFWGVVAGESVTALQFAGMLVILAGVRLANK